MEDLDSHICISQIVEDEISWGRVKFLIQNLCLYGAQFRNETYILIVAREVVAVLEEERGSKLERAVSKPVDTFIAILNIKGDGDDVETLNEQII